MNDDGRRCHLGDGATWPMQVEGAPSVQNPNHAPRSRGAGSTELTPRPDAGVSRELPTPVADGLFRVLRAASDLDVTACVGSQG